MKNSFRLSNSGRLAVMMSLGMSVPAMAGGITAAGAHNHQAGISQAANGAQVVNIVAPNQNGLSHNTYGNYNVDNHGAVLNNSLKAGNSQLAGHLNANNKFHGETAKVILNEVITRNPSLLLGKQEVFGMVADYVLANPNGITCNGCGFINTSKESLVVGKPIVEQGKLNAYSTIDNTNTLNIGNKGVQGNQVLNMIAPKINVRGNVTAKDTINGIAGQNTINTQGEVLTTNNKPLGNLDSYYLGSMQAGTINLVSTDAGSGINLKGNIHALSNLNANSKGGIDLEAAKLQGGDINLAAEHLNIHGKFSQSDDAWSDPENYKNYRGQIDHTKSSHSERLEQSKLAGKNITLVGYGDNHITAADIAGDNVDISGGKVLVNAQRINNTDNEHDHRWYYTWDHNDSKMHRQSLQKTTHVNAKNAINIKSNKTDVDLIATKLSAKEIHIAAQDDVRINGTVSQEVSEHKMTRKNEGKGLLTGHVTEINRQEKYISSDINGADDVTIRAGGNLMTLGAKVHSGGDIRVVGGKGVSISTGSANTYTLDEQKLKSWGGIGGGADGKKEHDSKIITATDMTADGKILLSGTRGVAITGSQVHAKQGGYVQSEQGSVRVDNATNHSSDSLSTRSGGAFNITSYSKSEITQQQKASGSKVSSNSNLTLSGGKTVHVTGSDLSAKDHLSLDSSGNINITAGKTEITTTTDSTDLNGTHHAKKVGDKQYSAGIGFEHNHHHEIDKTVNNTSSNVSGGTVDISSGKNVGVDGSNITSTGDTTISGSDVTIGSVQNTEHKETTDTKTSMGIYVTGGADKGAIGVNTNVTHTKGEHNKTQDKGSSTQIGGNLNINASGTLTQHGSKHDIKGDYNANADKVVNIAGTNTESSKQSSTSVGVDVSVGADYSKTSRPLIDGADKLIHGDIAGAVSTVKGTKVDLTEVQGGVTVNTGHESSSSVHTSVTGNQITAGNVNVNAKGDVKDQSTHYTAKDGVHISSDTYHNDSVYNHDETSHSKTDVSIGVAVGTKTGADINVHVTGKGHHESNTSRDDIAQTGSISGAKVVINTSNKASLEGTKVSGSKGVEITGTHGVSITQATDIHNKDGMKVDANIGVDVSSVGDTRNTGGAIGAHYSDTHNRDTQGHASSITGGNINISSDGNINAQGTNISGDKVNIASGGKVAISGATSSHSESAQHYGGDIHGGRGQSVSKGDSTSFGGSLDLGHSSTSSTTVTGSDIHAKGDVNINANGQGHDAISVEGGKIAGSHTHLDASHGGVDIHASTNTQNNSSWNAGIKADTSLTGKQDKDPSKGKHKDTGISGGIEGGYQHGHGTEHANASIGGDSLTINSQGDVTIAGGNVNVSNMDGNIQGNMNISSVKDQKDSTGGNIKVSVPTVHFGGDNAKDAAKPAKPLTNKDIKNTAIDIAKKFKDSAISGSYHNDHSDKVNHQAGINVTGNANVNVAGNANVNGASVNANAGAIHAQSTSKQDITGSDSHHSINANLTDVAKGVLGLGGSGKPNYQNTNATNVTLGTVTYGRS